MKNFFRKNTFYFQDSTQNMIWLLVDRIIRLGGGLLIILMLARYLGPENFGLLNFALAYVTIFSAIANLGLKDLIIKDLNLEAESTNEILGSALLMSIIGSILSYALLVIGIFFIKPMDSLAAHLVILIGLIIFFKPGDVFAYWFESQVKSKYHVAALNISFFLFALIKIILVINNASLFHIAIAIVGESMLTFVLLLFLFHTRAKLLSSIVIVRKRILNLINNGWPMLLSSIAILLYMRVDQVMLGIYSSNEEVGIYSVAAKLSEVWYFIPSIIVVSVYPKLIKLRSQKYNLYITRFQNLLDLLTLISIPIAILFSFISTYLIITLFGEAYENSGRVLAIHIWASVPLFLGIASSRWYISAGLQKLLFMKTLISCFINIALNIMLIPEYGAVGAAYATVVSQLLITFVYDLFIPKARELILMKLKSFNIIRTIPKLFYKKF